MILLLHGLHLHTRTHTVYFTGQNLKKKKTFNINSKVIKEFEILLIPVNIYQLFHLMELSFRLSLSPLKWHNKVHPFILLSCTLLTLLPPSPLPSRLTPCSSFIPKVSKFLSSLNTKHHCLLNFWWWLKRKKKRRVKHLSIKTSQAGFRCSSPELHPYSKGIAPSTFLPSSKLSCWTVAAEDRKPCSEEELINTWQSCTRSSLPWRWILKQAYTGQGNQRPEGSAGLVKSK